MSGGHGPIDVGDFLRELGLQQYEAAFRDNRIDIRVLPKLTAEDLKDLGVTLVGDRRMLLDASDHDGAIREFQAEIAEQPESVLPRLRIAARKDRAAGSALTARSRWHTRGSHSSKERKHSRSVMAETRFS